MFTGTMYEEFVNLLSANTAHDEICILGAHSGSLSILVVQQAFRDIESGE